MADKLMQAQKLFEQAQAHTAAVEQEAAEMVRKARQEEKKAFERYCLELGKKQYAVAGKREARTVPQERETPVEPQGIVAAEQEPGSSGRGMKEPWGGR